jgi:asparagine synthase (glutamine-hydrolysing)
MSAVLEHRGPDDCGYLGWDSRGCVEVSRSAEAVEGSAAALLHRRLSILDLSEAGWQPMGTEDGRYYIVLNGEIYNFIELKHELERLGFTFRSNSDTEVLLKAYVQWGKACLAGLVGMFAFAVLDTTERSLFLARDFFGIKPLYYVHLSGGVAFTSEIKALLELPGVDRTINPARLFDYLQLGLTDHGGETLFLAIRQLPPAHYLEVDLERPSGAEPVRYWQVHPDVQDISFEDAAVKLRELFVESVALHLRSDVSLGVALSGGIDSSAILSAVCAVQGEGAEIHAVSYVADSPVLNEERWVDRAARSAGAVVHKTSASATQLAADLEQLILQQEEPFGSTSIFAQRRVFQAAREAGIKVMLDGQGADELLGGYRTYLVTRAGSLIRSGRLPEAARFLMHAARLPGMTRAEILSWVTGRFIPGFADGLGVDRIGKDRMGEWLDLDWFAEHGVQARSNHTSRNLMDRLCESVCRTSLPMLLRFEDRNAMAFSLENRTPFLTPALVTFVLSLPEHYILSPTAQTKAVFREAMRGLVPDGILDRRDKIGFATPEGNWLATLGPWVQDVLGSDTARRIPALRLNAVQRRWSDVLTKRRNFNSIHWRWLNLILWAERFDVLFDI